MYSAPDFVKISIKETAAFASASSCDPSWEMNNWEFSPDCKQVIIEGMGEEYNCYFKLNP